MKTLDTRSASSLYFIAAETPLFLTSMKAPWIFLFVAADLSFVMRSLLPAAPALSASALIAASASAGSCGGASPPPIASFAAPMRPSMIDEYTCAAQFHVSMHWPTCNHHCGARRFRTRRDKGSSITVGDVQLTWTRGATSLGLAS